MVDSVPIILETGRFYLRELNVRDAGSLYKLNLHPDIYRFTGDPPFESIHHSEQFLESYNPYATSGMGRWAVISKQDGVFTGWCGLKYLLDENEVDIGYRLLPEFWGQGIAVETATACCAYGFRVAGLKQIVARVHKENIRSVRVAEKMNMVYEKDLLYNGVPWFSYVLAPAAMNPVS
jgi:RimJ/RimL family protein N-acetyltransferase